MQQVLLKTAGFDHVAPEYDMTLTAQNYREAQWLLDAMFANNTPKEFIGINLGSSKKGELRRWPVQRHAELVKKITEHYPDKGVVVFNGPDDRDVRQLFEDEFAQLPPQVKFTPGNMEVGAFMAMISKMKLLVSSDTFAFHAAKSQQISTIVLAGPMPENELELQASDVLLSSKMPCSPCYHQCSQNIAGMCMLMIQADAVMEGIHSILDTDRAA